MQPRNIHRPQRAAFLNVEGHSREDWPAILAYAAGATAPLDYQNCSGIIAALLCWSQVASGWADCFLLSSAAIT